MIKLPFHKFLYSTKRTLRYLWYNLLTTLLSIILLIILKSAGLNISIKDSYANDISNEQNMLLVFLMCFDGVIVSPLFEEITFRLALKPNMNRIALCTAFLLSIIFLLPTGIGSVLKETFGYVGPISYILLGLMLYIGLLSLFNRVDNVYRLLYNCWNSYFMIYASSIAFGLAHTRKIGDGVTDIWLYIPILLPYVISGYIFAKARLKDGFVVGFATHALFNLLVITLNLLHR